MPFSPKYRYILKNQIETNQDVVKSLSKSTRKSNETNQDVVKSLSKRTSHSQ